MTISIEIKPEHLKNLDLTPVTTKIEPLLQQGAIATWEQSINFVIDYPREADDPREVSEIPEVRLWFVRLDSRYPWLPFCLDWKSGELPRYTAMLVPHEFNRNEGIQYNPEALAIFVTHKSFILSDWLKQQQIKSRSRVKSMAQLFGYELDEVFLDLLEIE
ncbi:CRR6 family NdhI maturation factor [Gloeocapsa sp. PCC 73106]|uniref:CRR6 family NdhI maturation factor n=1 Tax=Gloeocapsa sp. PCC 73106 TaxID=102232 RepID=UPI0002ABC2DF|nr:CRR6 family NdhI maturation factor [Gloeocapsa sp. PCC 73106]ELR99873.1 hypothetical protein GLO73106DRAFT_00037260 [Gloeocapsa sp. PCC 73106]